MQTEYDARRCIIILYLLHTSIVIISYTKHSITRCKSYGLPPRTYFTNKFLIVMEISFCSHPNLFEVISTIFCTWHDSCAVVACEKFW